MPNDPDTTQALETRASQTTKDQLFVVSPRLEQSMVADLRPLVIPLGLPAGIFRNQFGGTADE